MTTEPRRTPCSSRRRRRRKPRSEPKSRDETQAQPEPKGDGDGGNGGEAEGGHDSAGPSGSSGMRRSEDRTRSHPRRPARSVSSGESGAEDDTAKLLGSPRFGDGDPAARSGNWTLCPFTGTGERERPDAANRRPLPLAARSERYESGSRPDLCPPKSLIRPAPGGAWPRLPCAARRLWPATFWPWPWPWACRRRCRRIPFSGRR
jgi:hypothetical protein